MTKRMQVIFVFLLLATLFFPSNTVLSQEDDPNLLSERGIQIIWQMGLTTSLGGKDDANTLRSIRDKEQRGFDDMIAHYEDLMAKYECDGHAYDILKVFRKARMNFLDKQIKLAEERARQSSVLVHYAIFMVLENGADSVDENVPVESNSVVDKVLPILQKQTKQNATDMFYGHIASRIPDSGSAISSSSSQIYHADAGLPTPPPPVVSGDNTPTAMAPSAPIIVPTVSNVENSGGSDVNIFKPLRFTNAGLYDATVRAFSYTPAEGVTAGISGASTVVFRDSNPSSYLDLPLGTYVFCYDWDLGTDANQDGYVDYAHKNTGSVTISVSSSDDTASAQVITLNPQSMNNPNGKCGETAPPPSGNAGGLTPQELVNQGTHTYAMNCVCNGASALECDFWGGDWDPFGATIEFVEGGVNLTDEEGATYFQTKLGVNTYDYADNMVNGKLTFTDVGMIYSGEGLICTALRR